MDQNNLQMPRCQCSPSCNRPVVSNSILPFCSVHAQRCPRKSPLSGFEPPYEPDRWNTRKEVRETHNCFSYAFNFIDPKQILLCLNKLICKAPYHQPGSASDHPKLTRKDPKTCPNMISRLMGDNPSLEPTEFEKRCPSGTSKIALIVDSDQDYHFLRQDSNQWFSEKHGGLPVTNTDAQGRLIYDVQLANHNWSKPNDPLNYDIFCGYFCVPRDRPLFLRVGGGKKRDTTHERLISVMPLQNT